MRKFLKLSQISLFAGIFLTSCLGSKFLEEDQKILAKQRVVGVSGSLADNSTGLFEEKRNSRVILGYPFTHLAHLYKMGENGFIFKGYDKQKAIAKRDSTEAKYDKRIALAKSEKKEKRLKNKKAKKYDKRNRKVQQGNQLMRWGEPLSIYSHASTRLTAEKIRQYLSSKGYFEATIKIDTSNYDSLGSFGKFGRDLRDWVSGWAGNKGRYINLDYHIDLNNQFYIDSIEYQIEDPLLAELVAENLKEAPLQEDFYDQEHLSEERDFLYDLAVNNGYYEFSKQYIGFQIDSTMLGKDTLTVRTVIKNPPGESQHKIFYIDSVVFISDASITQSELRTEEQFGDVTFSFAKNRYSKKVLSWRIPLEQDDPYSRDLTIETQRQLSFLDNFKFTNINYDTANNHFVANIFTSPFEKFQTSSEFGFSRTQGRPGPFANINIKNRNTFRTLEILSFDANAKLEDLRSIRDNSTFDGNYTSRQFGVEGAISFPQFLFPLGSYTKNKMGRFNPKTRLSLSYSFEDRVDEYRRQTYTATWAYSWQLKDQVRYTLTPLQIGLTDANTIGQFEIFVDSLIQINNPYGLAFVPAIVSSSAFQVDIAVGGYDEGKDGGYIRLNTELGGILNEQLNNSVFGNDLETYEYAKIQVDLRKIERLTRNTNLALRLNAGLAYPYGDNGSLPYDRYFFAGGSSSIRAWRPRRLGPGSHAIFVEDTEGVTDVVDYSFEQQGNVLIESSIEIRQDLVGFLEGAFFIDAGNIWQVRETLVGPDLEGDDGIFDVNNFLEEMAVGTGIGLRFDLQFLIFRVDLGSKLIDPAQKRGERFVGKEFFTNFRRNTEVNIGIGYPF